MYFAETDFQINKRASFRSNFGFTEKLVSIVSISNSSFLLCANQQRSSCWICPWKCIRGRASAHRRWPLPLWQATSRPTQIDTMITWEFRQFNWPSRRTSCESHWAEARKAGRTEDPCGRACSTSLQRASSLPSTYKAGKFVIKKLFPLECSSIDTFFGWETR